jgi:3-oxoacyl-[acyl-carrier protein] reductase
MSGQLPIEENSLAGLRQAGGDASIHQGNVGDAEDCRSVVGEVIERHGRLDILVNNAGVTVDRPMLTMTVDDWHKGLRVNLSGAFYMCQPALAHMLERGSERIINISSVVGETGNIGQTNYAASKSGPLGLTKTLAREAAFALDGAGQLDGGGIGLTVNAITPGLIETEMTGAVPPKVIDKLQAMILTCERGLD